MPLYRKPSGELVLRSMQALERPNRSRYYLVVDDQAQQHVVEAADTETWIEMPAEADAEFKARPLIREFLEERERERLSVRVCTRGQRREYCQTPGHGGKVSVALCDWPIHRVKHRARCEQQTGQVILNAVITAAGVTTSPCGCPIETKTCDRRMCPSCRHPVPGKHNTDYCPAHHEMAKRKDI